MNYYEALKQVKNIEKKAEFMMLLFLIYQYGE